MGHLQRRFTIQAHCFPKSNEAYWKRPADGNAIRQFTLTRRLGSAFATHSSFTPFSPARKRNDTRRLGSAFATHSFYQSRGKRKIRFCQGIIQHLQNSETNASLTTKEKLAIIARAYLHLAMIYEQYGTTNKVVEALNSSLNYAARTAENDTRFSVLYAGGLCYGRLYAFSQEPENLDAWEQAVAWLQRSLRYIEPPAVRSQIVLVYQSLGRVLADNPAAYLQTKFIYDWLLLINDAPLEDMLERFKVL
ncbi:MAG TPA: hypothetical protein VFB38_18565 [Chthonomonadaceae bacterium]|nr:hypothetical protein [Chthonomonadaceae bacterium]